MNNATIWNAAFGPGEEYARLRFQFLIALLFLSALGCTLFVLADRTQANVLGTEQLSVTLALLGTDIALLAVLYGRRGLFLPAAVTFCTANMLTYFSAFIFVPQDELRVLWFYVSIPAIYILLGRRAGILATVAALLAVSAVNAEIDKPLSSNALTTFGLSLMLFSGVFYAYTTRAISFFRHMVDSNEQLRRQVLRDPLTDVLNARAYYEISDRFIQASQRSGRPSAALFVDLDHFKHINDNYGHAAGDVVLKEVAACLSNHARASDVVGRVGGEEFSLFLPDTDHEGATTLAEALRARIEALMPKIGDCRLSVTASIGVAISHPGHDSIAQIQRDADQAMYAAKRQGRNRVLCFAELSPLSAP